MVHGCTGTLKDLTLCFIDFPMTNELSDICTYLHIIYAGLYPEYGLVSLASFPNLRSIRWEGEASVHYALRQLQMVDSRCEITEVCFSVILNCEFLRESSNIIDDILATTSRGYNVSGFRIWGL